MTIRCRRLSCVRTSVLRHRRSLLMSAVAILLLWFAVRWGRPISGSEPAADSQFECWDHYSTSEKHCRRLCHKGEFSLEGMSSCLPWLTCEDFKQFEVLRQLGEGAVKRVYLVQWNDALLAYNVLSKPEYSSDFAHGAQMLRWLQSSGKRRFVTQLVGTCESSASYATEYHALGTAERAAQFLTLLDMPRSAALAALHACASYVRVLEFMHGGNDGVGVAVMCDANDLRKLLSQLLLREDLSVVANDLDATPVVNGSSDGMKTVKCGHRQLFGDFVAPEQLWPFGDDIPFDDARMPGYTEKVDIYKAPDVCDHFLQAVPEAYKRALTYRLFSVHRRCKSARADARPNATELRLEYERVIAMYS